MDVDVGTGSVEVLEFQLANCPAVHSVSEVAAKRLNVKEFHAVSHLFVVREGHLDVAVLDFGVLDEVLHRTDNFCHTGFVVGAE